jgi:hypothetical protein
MDTQFEDEIPSDIFGLVHPIRAAHVNCAVASLAGARGQLHNQSYFNSIGIIEKMTNPGVAQPATHNSNRVRCAVITDGCYISVEGKRSVIPKLTHQ